jgi:hypothetical protein
MVNERNGDIDDLNLMSNWRCCDCEDHVVLPIHCKIASFTSRTKLLFRGSMLKFEDAFTLTLSAARVTTLRK